MFTRSKLFALGVAAAAAFTTLVVSGDVGDVGDGEFGIKIGINEADAQRYRRARPRSRVGVMIFPRGLYFGGGLVGTKILTQSGGPELLEDGAGLTLYGGLRVSRALALELGWVGTAHNPETVDVGFGPETDFLVLNGFTADAKIFVGGPAGIGTQPGANGRRAVGGAQPFLQGGLGVYFLDSSAFGTQSIGTGFQLGGGVNWMVGRNVDLGLRGLYRGIAMGPPETNQNDTFVSAVSVEGNLTFRF